MTENTTLDKVKKGSSIKIVKIPSGDSRIQLLRMGIIEGDNIICLERLPGGTVVIQKNRQEIAIGHTLAKKIMILPE
jgi:ferrous iron transport protein A